MYIWGVYRRDYASVGRRKNKGPGIIAVILLLIMIAGVIWAGTVIFPTFTGGRESYETWSYKKADEISEISLKAMSLRSQKKIEEFAPYEKQVSLVKKGLLERKPPSKYEEPHSLLVGTVALLEIMTQKAEKKVDYYSELVAVKELLDRWIEVVSKEKEVSEFNFSRIKLDLSRAEPKTQEKPKESSKPVRRGLAIVSLATKPKQASYDSAKKTYYYDKADVMSVTVEIQNQGEVTETSIVVRLTLRSSISGQTEETTRQVERLKPTERKPVTFENILPDTSDNAENVIKVFVEPVPQEKYLFNNERIWRFRWKE